MFFLGSSTLLRIPWERLPVCIWSFLGGRASFGTLRCFAGVPLLSVFIGHRVWPFFIISGIGPPSESLPCSVEFPRFPLHMEKENKVSVCVLRFSRFDLFI